MLCELLPTPYKMLQVLSNEKKSQNFELLQRSQWSFSEKEQTGANPQDLFLQISHFCHRHRALTSAVITNGYQRALIALAAMVMFFGKHKID